MQLTFHTDVIQCGSDPPNGTGALTDTTATSTVSTTAAATTATTTSNIALCPASGPFYVITWVCVSVLMSTLCIIQ